MLFSQDQLLRWLSGKEPAGQWRKHKRRRFDLWVRKIPRRRARQPTPVFLPRESHGQRSLVSYRPVHFSHSVVSDSLRPRGLQHTRPPCPSPTPGVYSNSCLLSRWCHPTISSSVLPFSSCPQSFPASGSFQMSQLFVSGGQSIGVSAPTSILPMNTQDWSPLGWTDWISLQPKGLSRVFFNTTTHPQNIFFSYCLKKKFSIQTISIQSTFFFIFIATTLYYCCSFLNYISTSILNILIQSLYVRLTFEKSQVSIDPTVLREKMNAWSMSPLALFSSTLLLV